MVRTAFLTALLLLLAACGQRSGNPAPPRVDTPAQLPVETSTIVVPVSARLAELESLIEARAPRTLWTIDRREPRCIPAQRVTFCAIPKKECRNGKCRETGCRVGLKRTKVTPDIACRIVGKVTRGRIRLGGSGSALTLTMPVQATISARDVGGVIKQETATGSADVRAAVKLSVNRQWAPVAKVDIAYDWTDPPGINFLGQRIRFVQRTDAKLKGVIARLERDLPRALARLNTRPAIEAAWRHGFATIMLNRERPPV